MKEATGELSTTMIAVVAIAAVLTIFTVVLLPYLRGQINARMHCTDASCTCQDGEATCPCVYIDENDQTHDIVCQNPNHN